MPRPLSNPKGIAHAFNMPNIAGQRYNPGRQPFNPGESQADSGGPAFNPIPWPNVVPTLTALASTPGKPTGRALQISNNSEAVLPSNFLYIGGFVGKSKG